MKRRTVIIVALLSAAALSGVPGAYAWQPSQDPTRSEQSRPPAPNATNAPTDPFADVMFPPDMIMRHARELGLTDEQKHFMRSEIQKTTTRFNELQWQLQDGMEQLHETMRSTSVNEKQALSILDKVLDIEREIKHLHIGLGIRIKNQLTSEQQTKLRTIRMMSRGE